MRWFLLVICITSSVFAQQQPLAAHRSATRMRTAGVTLTAIGAAAILHGIILMAIEASHNNSCGRPGDPCGDAKGLLMVPGGILLGVGGAFAAAGIPLWVVGQKRVRATGPLAVALTF